MERNLVIPLIRMKMDNFRAEIRRDYFKQIFSLKRGDSQVNQDLTNQNFEIFTPEKNFEKQEWILKVKQRVIEITESEKGKNVNRLKSLVSMLLEELKQDAIVNFTTNDFEDLNFFSIFKVIICNIDYLQDEDLIYNLIWCMGILINDENIQYEYLKEKKAIDILFFLLTKTSYKIQSMCCFILGNLFTNADIRDYCLELGIIDYIKKFYDKINVPAYLVNDLIFLSNKIIIKPLPPYEKIQGLLPLFNFSLDKANSKLFEEDTFQDVLFSLSEMSNGPQNQIDDFIKLKIPEKTVEICLDKGINNAGRFALRVLGNLVTGENNTSRQVIDAGILEIIDLYYNFQSNSSDILLEICWIMSNILACGEEIVEIVLKSNVYKYMFEIPTKVATSAFVEEGAIMIYNFSKSAKFNQILTVIDKFFLDLIEFILGINERKAVLTLCKSIKKILKKEKEWSSENQNKYPFKENLEKKNIDKRFRMLLINEDELVFYYADAILNFLEKD